MVATVPSLESKLYLTDPQYIIVYSLLRALKTPANTIPIVSKYVVSIADIVSRFQLYPDDLVNAIQAALQPMYNRIFGDEQNIKVNVIHQATVGQEDGYDVIVTIMYTTPSGELSPLGITITLQNGMIILPDSNLLSLK